MGRCMLVALLTSSIVAGCSRAPGSGADDDTPATVDPEIEQHGLGPLDHLDAG